jgi:tetraacyldisaccharide 4'-kinase
MKFRCLRRMLAGLYRGITATRNWSYDKGYLKSVTSALPVVSVGNITAGGNAKTPLVLYIASLLKEAHFSPVILSRGYRGSECGPYVVSKDDNVSRVGDEALMMATRAVVPIVVSRARCAGATLIEDQKLGNIILLDDGLQHRALDRSVNLVSIDVSSQDAIDRFIAGELLPLGFFREDRDHALKRADAVIFSSRQIGSDFEVDPCIKALIPPGVPQFRANFKLRSVSHLNAKADAATGPAQGAEVFICTAIANPTGFRRTVEDLGYKVKGEQNFRDHHAFSAQELVQVVATAQGIPIMCTEKDATKLPPDFPGRDQFAVVRIEAQLLDAQFREWLLERILRR